MVAIPGILYVFAGQKNSAAAFNSGVSDPLQFLFTNHPRCHVFDNTAISIPNAGTGTLITWNSEAYDSDTMHNPAADPSRITFTTGGNYDVDYLITMPPGAYTQLDLNVRLNSGGLVTGGVNLRTQNYSDGVRSNGNISFRFSRLFAAGDYVEVFVSQTSGAARATSTTMLGMRALARWIGTP